MTVSICVPVYGVEKYIERCARSLFEQTYEDIEYIFVDDCTPDKSIEILYNIIEQYPMRKPHVRIVKHERNRGLAAARNTAVECCQTEFLMHVDSDDWIDLNAIERSVIAQKETNADIVTIGLKRINNGIAKIDLVEWTNNPRVMTERVISHKVHNGVWGRLIRHSLYIDNGIKVEVGRGQAEDLQVVPRLFYYSNRTDYIDNVFYNYIMDNPSSYTSTFSFQKFDDARKALLLLASFFRDKGAIYEDAVKNRMLKQIVDGLTNCAKANANKEDYAKIKMLQNADLMKCEYSLDYPSKVILHINSYFLLKVYVRIATNTKALMSKFLHSEPLPCLMGYYCYMFC